MNGYRADPRYDADAGRAAATKRWLEQSGPRYCAFDLVFLGQFLPLGDPHGFMRLRMAEVVCDIRQGQMSYASWQRCLAAHKGDLLNLKIRVDPVALISLPA
jgi:hypothetical protein